MHTKFGICAWSLCAFNIKRDLNKIYVFKTIHTKSIKKLILKEGCTQVEQGHVDAEVGVKAWAWARLRTRALLLAAEQGHVHAEVGLGAGMGVGKAADPGVAACG